MHHDVVWTNSADLKLTPNSFESVPTIKGQRGRSRVAPHERAALAPYMVEACRQDLGTYALPSQFRDCGHPAQSPSVGGIVVTWTNGNGGYANNLTVNFCCKMRRIGVRILRPHALSEGLMRSQHAMPQGINNIGCNQFYRQARSTSHISARR